MPEETAYHVEEMKILELAGHDTRKVAEMGSGMWNGRDRDAAEMGGGTWNGRERDVQELDGSEIRR